MSARARRGHVRDVVQLWPLRQRRHAVIVCLEDPGAFEAARAQLEELRAELVVEREPGPLSAALGRPSVTVASRYGRVGWRGGDCDLDGVLGALEAFELDCPECGPQAWGDPGGLSRHPHPGWGCETPFPCERGYPGSCRGSETRA